MDVNIDSMIVCVSIFSCSFSVKIYYYIALRAVFNWICVLHVFIIIIIIIIIIMLPDPLYPSLIV